MTPNEFFNKIVKENNYMDPVTVMELYYSMLKVIISELNENGEIRLVDFGTFRLHESKARKMHNVNTGRQCIVPPRKIVKFRPSTKLKSYIRNKL